MAGLVSAFAQKAAASQPRFAPTAAQKASGQKSSGDGWWQDFTSGLQGIGDALGGITGQQGSGNAPRGQATSGGSTYPGSANAANTGPYPSPPPRTYTRDNSADIQAIIDQYRMGTDSAIAGINGQRAAMMNNQAARQGAYDAQEAAYRNQLNSSLAEAALGIKETDIQQANFPQWYQFVAEQWGNRMTAGKHELDFIAQQQVNSANQRLIDWREIQQGRKEVGQQAERATREATSSATVSGVIQGAKQDFADIDTERGNALFDLDTADARSRLNETQRRQELANRRHQLIADLTSFDISTREQQARLREREQLLGVEAERARLRPRQLMDAMNVTMANLGLDRVMSTGQFLEGMANANAQEQALLQQFLRDAAAWNNLIETWQSPNPPASRGGRPANPGTQNWDRQGFR